MSVNFPATLPFWNILKFNIIQSIQSMAVLVNFYRYISHSKGVLAWDQNELRPRMNLHRYEIFAAICMKPGRNAWCLVSGWNDILFLSNKYMNMADPKAYRLEIYGLGLIFVVIYMRLVWTQTGTRISCLGPATKKKSDRSEYIVKLVLCKRIKRNAWRPIQIHAGLSLSRSHVNIP